MAKSNIINIINSLSNEINNTDIDDIVHLLHKFKKSNHGNIPKYKEDMINSSIVNDGLSKNSKT